MQNLLDELTQLLQKDDRFTAEGKLLKNKVIEAALQLDPALLKLLLTHKSAKKHFFQEVDGISVFDKAKFQRFISNKSFLPDSYTAFKNKIGLTSNDEFISEGKEVVLSWPYKDCVLEGGQTKEDEKRDEIFWNETLAPEEIDRLFSQKVFTNFKKYDSKGGHKVTDISLKDNMIIRGNNLLALYSLLPIYRGRIKLIYIDPPYNTGSDSFKYNDSFNETTWLTFMRNRLLVAKDLLKSDGFLFVQCDDNEQAYLKALLDEIFPGNYVYTLYVQVRYEGKTLVEDMDFQKLIETIHVYRKSNLGKLKKEEEDYSIDKFIWKIKEIGKPKKIKLGGKDVEIFSVGDYEIIEDKPDSMNLKEIWASGKILDGNSSGRFFRDYLQNRVNSDGIGTLYKVYDIGDDQFDYRYFTGPKRAKATKGKYYQGIPNDRLNNDANNKKYLPIINFYNLADYFGNCRHEGGVEMRSGKKPEELLKRIIELATDPNDIVLDFHLGSGTTCAVSLKMARNFIGIEQLDYGQNDGVNRLKNVISGDKTGISEDYNWNGGGSFIYYELAEFNDRFSKQIKSAKTTKDLKQIWGRIKEDGFISYKVNPKEIDKNISEFEQLSLKDQKKFLIEVLDKNHLYVNYSEIDDKDYKISEEDKKLNKKFYSLK